MPSSGAAQWAVRERRRFAYFYACGPNVAFSAETETQLRRRYAGAEMTEQARADLEDLIQNGQPGVFQVVRANDVDSIVLVMEV